MDVFRMMAVLIAYPLLALVPAAVFFALFAVARRSLMLMTALLWLAYVPYEYGMKLRLLCSGECNIRVDLLLIYPVLVVLTLVSLVVFATTTRKRA
jgi:hypothetical protein